MAALRFAFILVTLAASSAASATTLPPAPDAPLPVRQLVLPPPAASWQERALFDAPQRIEMSERIACRLVVPEAGHAARCG